MADAELQPLLAGIVARTSVAVHVADRRLVFSPRNFREACEAQRLRAELARQEALETVLSLALVRQISEPNQRACTVKVGAAAQVDEVETFLKGWSLTLGWLSPGARTLSVGQWLQSRYAGLRVVPGNRLETAALTVSVALEGGGGWEGTRAPRSAAGPELSAAFVGAGRGAGMVVEAVLRALPRYELTERVHGELANAQAVVSLLRKALQRDVPVVEARCEKRGGALDVTLSVAGPAFRVRRDRQVVEELLRGSGEVHTVRRVPVEQPQTVETELGWEALAGVLAAQPSVTLYRLARESVVAATAGPLDAGSRLSQEPEAMARAFVEAVGRGQEKR